MKSEESTVASTPSRNFTWPVLNLNFSKHSQQAQLQLQDDKTNIPTSAHIEHSESIKGLSPTLQSQPRLSIIQRATAKLFSQKGSMVHHNSPKRSYDRAAAGDGEGEEKKSGHLNPGQVVLVGTGEPMVPKTTETWFVGSVEEPLNREPSPDVLINGFISEKDVYDRNHGPIPHINADTHILRIDGSVKNFLNLSVPHLRTLPQHTVISALQCAGNRRHTMRTKEKEVWGIDWRNGAVMNASWTGVLLSDLLKAAVPTLDKEQASHVAFSCYQTATQDDGYYGGSIPLKWAIDEDMEVLIALKMNGKDLTPERGYPVRAIVPGVAGARAVKWLDRITVQKQESSNAYQQRDYKILPPQVETKEQAEGYWHKLPSILDMPVNSVIVSPESDTEIQDPTVKPLVIEGYALPKGVDGPVVRVEISKDKGKTWEDAEIVTEATRWSWVLWRFEYSGEVDEETVFWSRATDKAGNTQVEGGQWNLRGVAYNAFGELTGLKVKKE